MSVQNDLASIRDFYQGWQAGKTTHGDHRLSFKAELDKITAIANEMFDAEESLLQDQWQEAEASGTF